MRWLERTLKRIAIEAIRPVLRQWLFGRVLYLSESDLSRLAKSREQEILVRALYGQLLDRIEQEYDRLEEELLKRI